MNKKGYTLTEMLIVLSILGIVGGIATISYKGYNLSVNKRDLKLHGELFASAVKTCISNYGAWKIKNSPLPDATDIFPCKVQDGQHHTRLKTRLNFTCPTDDNLAGQGCLTIVNDTEKVFCLVIQKIVSGKTLQVITRVHYDNPNNYDIWCSKETPVSDPAIFLKICHKKTTYKDSMDVDQNMKTHFEKDCANFK